MHDCHLSLLSTFSARRFSRISSLTASPNMSVSKLTEKVFVFVGTTEILLVKLNGDLNDIAFVVISGAEKKLNR